MQEKEQKRRNYSLLFFILGLLGIAYPFIIPGGDSDMGFALFFAGLVVGLTSLILFFMFASRARAAAHMLTEGNLLADWISDGENIKIFTQGIYYLNELTYFKSPFCVLEGVGMHPKKPNRLVFHYTLMSGRNLGSQENTIECTIPAGEEKTAEQIVAFFNLPLPMDYVDRFIAKEPHEGWDIELEAMLDADLDDMNKV